MRIYTTEEIAERVRPVAEAYGIDRVYLFGSYARGEATAQSDIDLYVEFSRPLGLRYCSFFDDMAASIGKPIDMITREGLYNPVTLGTNAPLIRRINEEGRCIYG